jgi:hypothetical protein
MNRVLLRVRRFKQRPGECAVAAASSLANFYDESVNYNTVRKTALEMCPNLPYEGMYTSQQARLLNILGYMQVSIVTADLDFVDFSWATLDKESIIQRLKKMRTHYRRKSKTNTDWNNYYEYAKDMIKWLEDPSCDNQLIIDHDFPKYIRRYLDLGRPVAAAVNWTSLFKRSKGNPREDGDIKGEAEDHALIVRGYDDEGVFVVDSHTSEYKGGLAKFANGYYKIRWEKFLVNIPAGDLILVR